jgi:hypothetical protein
MSQLGSLPDLVAIQNDVRFSPDTVVKVENRAPLGNQRIASFCSAGIAQTREDENFQSGSRSADPCRSSAVVS